MKKILFTMMILFGISAFSSNSYETDLVGRMKVLEEKVQTKLDSGVTADMREATTELSETWENELNTVYSLLMEKLPKAEKVKLENEQKKWLKNRNIKAKKDAKETVTFKKLNCNSFLNFYIFSFLEPFTKSKVSTSSTST